MNSTLKASNLMAIAYLASPAALAAAAVWLFTLGGRWQYWTGTLLLSFFFAQTFILLHECGHLNYFKTKSANKVLGHFFGFLTVIPFFTWRHIHNLHHRWTGWRDLDPTTEKTVALGDSKVLRFIVNACWWLMIPLFFLSYQFSNYWNLAKIRRFLPAEDYRRAVVHVIAYLLAYGAAFYFFFGPVVYYVLPAFALSLVWKELLIMTQHTHIEIPISEGREVRPISYMEQVQYTRSFYTFTFVSRYLLFNFNLHEVHHAYPGLPAYRMEGVDLNLPRKPYFSEWFVKAKSMKGEDYIFRTSKHTGIKI